MMMKEPAKQQAFLIAESGRCDPNFSLLKRYSNKLRKCVKKITYEKILKTY